MEKLEMITLEQFTSGCPEQYRVYLNVNGKSHYIGYIHWRYDTFTAWDDESTSGTVEPLFEASIEEGDPCYRGMLFAKAVSVCLENYTKKLVFPK